MNLISKKYPSVSIIIPLYNVEKFVVRCLDSVMAQDYPGKIECILIEDCSKDNTRFVVNEYLKKNADCPISFSIITHDSNQGVSVSRNEGTSTAEGDFLFYLDSDDYIFPETISLLANEVLRHPGIDIVMGKYIDNTGHKSYKKESIYRKNQFTTNKKWIQYQFLHLDAELPIACWNKLIRRNFIINNKIMFINAVIHEDNHWLYQVLNHIESLAFVFEPTYFYYTNISSAIHTTPTSTEKENWHRILLDYTKMTKRPFLRMKLGRFMVSYFNEHLYEYNFNNDKKLRMNYMITCIRCGDIKTAVLLFLMEHFHSLSNKFLIPEKIRQKAYWMYVNESNNYKKKYLI